MRRTGARPVLKGPRRSNAPGLPDSEAQFKTLKYRPDFPDRFGSAADARLFCRRFFDWYHTEHYHSGIAWHHPADVHYGRADAVHDARADVLDAAYQRHPERFVRKLPTPRPLPEAAWINKPPSQDQQPDKDTTHSKNP